VSSNSHLDRLRLLRRQLGSLLDQELLPGQVDPGNGDTPGAWVPTVDIFETSESYEIRAELPGVLREDLELRVVDASLEILGLRRAPGDSGNFQRMEGRYGPFHRVVTLGADADGDAIEARLARGVLDVRVAKKGKGSARREIAVDWSGDA